MDPLLAVALEAADAAARVHQTHFGKVGLDSAQEKAHSDFVTRVDLEAQSAAVHVIRRAFPDHGILAEEEDPAGGEGTGAREWPADEGYLWIIDPLDGTTNFLHRHPFFAASVGVGKRTRQGRETMEAGAVVAARTGDRWWARRGEGAWKNGRPIRVSDLRAFGSALVGTGFPFKKPDLVPRYTDQFKRILPASGGIRRTGSAALDLCFLAEGILDCFWEEDYLSPWDVAAGLIILEEAGGLAVRLDGSEIGLADGSVLAANSPELLEALGDLVRGE